MRVLSDGARRLINEMKKLRLSLIFNEQGRASASASERTRIQWPSVPGARRRRTSKYHLSESRRAFTCARLSTDSRETRAKNKKFRSYPCVPAVFSPSGEPSYGAATRQVRAETRTSPFSIGDREI